MFKIWELHSYGVKCQECTYKGMFLLFFTAVELHTEDNLVYQFYPAPSSTLNFKIKAPNDAHIALTSTPYASNPMYEIFFGGWSNTKSVIRKNQTKPEVTEVSTPNILDPYNYRGFWIRWDYGVISAGVEGNYNPILRWEDPALFHIQYFGVCTGWGAKGHWIIQTNTAPQGGYVPGAPPTPGIYPSMPAPGGGSYMPMPTPGGPNLSYPTAPQGYNPGGPGAWMPTTAPKWIPSSRGSVPPNAVAGGTDVSGETMYIARAHHEGALIPGKLVPSHGVAYVAWGGRENPKHDYEVLCDCSARWIPAVNGQCPPNAFVAGQTENGETLYVGRAHHEGSLTVGKVQPSHHVCYIPYGGNEVSHNQYEVLVV